LKSLDPALKQSESLKHMLLTVTQARVPVGHGSITVCSFLLGRVIGVGGLLQAPQNVIDGAMAFEGGNVGEFFFLIGGCCLFISMV
jgi:hypothetical protein